MKLEEVEGVALQEDEGFPSVCAQNLLLMPKWLLEDGVEWIAFPLCVVVVGLTPIGCPVGLTAGVRVLLLRILRILLLFLRFRAVVVSPQRWIVVGSTAVAPPQRISALLQELLAAIQCFGAFSSLLRRAGDANIYSRFP